MPKYWILIASKNHVMQAVNGGFAQANHGKSHPLRRMNVGDGLIYYSPKLEHGSNLVCQSFTAIGQVTGESIYPFDMGDGFVPSRREVRYLQCKPASITPLINDLTFIKDKQRWGFIFRFGIIHIPPTDFKLIASQMNININR